MLKLYRQTQTDSIYGHVVRLTSRVKSFSNSVSQSVVLFCNLDILERVLHHAILLLIKYYHGDSLFVHSFILSFISSPCILFLHNFSISFLFLKIIYFYLILFCCSVVCYHLNNKNIWSIIFIFNFSLIMVFSKSTGFLKL